jgi:hypothetical protein
MTVQQKEALDALVLNSQKVVACVSRQSTLGFLVEEALEALDRARETGLIQPLTVVTSSGIPQAE